MQYYYIELGNKIENFFITTNKVYGFIKQVGYKIIYGTTFKNFEKSKIITFLDLENVKKFSIFKNFSMIGQKKEIIKNIYPYLWLNFKLKLEFFYLQKYKLINQIFLLTLFMNNIFENFDKFFNFFAKKIKKLSKKKIFSLKKKILNIKI